MKKDGVQTRKRKPRNPEGGGRRNRNNHNNISAAAASAVQESHIASATSFVNPEQYSTVYVNGNLALEQNGLQQQLVDPSAFVNNQILHDGQHMLMPYAQVQQQTLANSQQANSLPLINTFCKLNKSKLLRTVPDSRSAQEITGARDDVNDHVVEENREDNGKDKDVEESGSEIFMDFDNHSTVDGSLPYYDSEEENYAKELEDMNEEEESNTPNENDDNQKHSPNYSDYYLFNDKKESSTSLSTTSTTMSIKLSPPTVPDYTTSSFDATQIPETNNSTSSNDNENHSPPGSLDYPSTSQDSIKSSNIINSDDKTKSKEDYKEQKTEKLPELIATATSPEIEEVQKNISDEATTEEISNVNEAVSCTENTRTNNSSDTEGTSSIFETSISVLHDSHDTTDSLHNLKKNSTQNYLNDEIEVTEKEPSDSHNETSREADVTNLQNESNTYPERILPLEKSSDDDYYESDINEVNEGPSTSTINPSENTALLSNNQEDIYSQNIYAELPSRTPNPPESSQPPPSSFNNNNINNNIRNPELISYFSSDDDSPTTFYYTLLLNRIL